MVNLVKNSSAIRAMFEEGKIMAAKYGAENVYDFSLGNPNVPAPAEVKKAVFEELEKEDPVVLHGYMNNSGYEDVRAAIADSINRKFQTSFGEKNIIMTVGAAGGLNVILKTLLNPGDEVIVIAPYFGEYNSYVSNYDGKIVVVSPNTETFQPNLEELEQKITARTKAVIINSPNNPSGVVFSRETLEKVAAILTKKSEELGRPVYLISDEPYRELVYDGVEVPWVPSIYKDTLVCYSYSKSLSLPGERIGYVYVPEKMTDAKEMFAAIAGASRVIGHVCPPTLIQRVVARCAYEKPDLEAYDVNRKLLYNGLKKIGYECASPDGAFYLFVKAPGGDGKAFSEKCKLKNLLVVPSDDFGVEGYFRLCYCVAKETIEKSLPIFEEVFNA